MIIVVVGMMLGGCGQDNTNATTDCWNDNDCPTHSKCLDNTCVYEPECEISSDCDLSQGIVCIAYKCKRYTDDDPCFGQECSNTCATCGMYTTCIDGICEDACFAREQIKITISDSTCEDILYYQIINCHRCKCWLDNHQIENNNGCQSYIINCSRSHAIQAKAQLEPSADVYKSAIENELRTACQD